MLSFIPVALVMFISYSFIAILIGQRKRVSINKQIFSFAFFLYVLALIDITFFPIPVDPKLIKLSRMHNSVIHQNWLPFSTIYFMVKYSRHDINHLINFIGNALLFVPFGFSIPIVTKKSFGRAISLGIIVIFTIELSQLAFSYLYGFTYRIFDVDDIILNTIGLLIGVIILRIFQVSKLKKEHSREGLH